MEINETNERSPGDGLCDEEEAAYRRKPEIMTSSSLRTRAMTLL
jgi:hypothetical protein